MLDAAAQSTLDQITADLRQLFGADMISLILYGSAAGDGFIAAQSDLNLAIVLGHVTAAQLRRLHGRLGPWRAQGLAPPLLIDRAFLRHACDVFPMELFDLQGQHRILWGEDVVTSLRISARNLRYQAEHEARSKLLRLRLLYAEFGDDAERLRALMRDSVKTFAVLLRNLLRLRSGEHLASLDALARRFEEVFDRRLPTLRQVLRMKLQELAWPQDPAALDALFAAYLGDIEALISLIDQLPAEHL